MKKIACLFMTFAGFLLSSGSAVQADPTTHTIPAFSACSFPDVILGTPGDDVILGTPGDDIICGLEGNDKIDGQGGDDIILGGGGDDSLTGGEGNDNLSGEIGSDYIEGLDGFDELWGGDGEDTLSGGPLDDYLSGGSGGDGLFGAQGNDILLGDAGNDSLNGGIGLDELQGGTGVNTCEKDKADKVSKCFYDMKGPKLNSIAIAPEDASLDSSIPTKKLHIRFNISDPGTGLRYGYLTFANNKTFQRLRREPTSSALTDSIFYVNFQIENVDRCTPESWEIPGTCLLSGSSVNGTYQSTVLLPKNMHTERYYLATVQLDDAVGHSTSISPSGLVSSNKAISFQQIGVNDIEGPRILDLNFSETSAFLEETTSILVDVIFTDAGGHGIRRLDLTYKSLNSKYTVDLAYRNDWSEEPLPLCSTIAQDANILGCVIAGDNEAGTLRLPMRLGGYSGFLMKGTKKLVSVKAMDRFENVSEYKKLNPSLITKTLMYQKFGRNGLDSDHTPPQITLFRSSRTRIDTSTNSQTVIFTIRAKDSGTGIGYADISVFGEGYSASMPFCKKAQRNISGNHYVEVKTTCVFPAHFPSGEYMVGLLVEDLSTNSNNAVLEGSQLSRFGYSGFLLNGI